MARRLTSRRNGTGLSVCNPASWPPPPVTFFDGSDSFSHIVPGSLKTNEIYHVRDGDFTEIFLNDVFPSRQLTEMTIGQTGVSPPISDTLRKVPIVTAVVCAESRDMHGVCEFVGPQASRAA